MRKVVVFPEPFGPIKAKTPLLAHLKLIESTAVKDLGLSADLPTIFLWSFVRVNTLDTSVSSIIGKIILSKAYKLIRKKILNYIK
tara:strand:+ start:226 stop:480 length:255 start_codon:yes stop_codon:yes gene_type:complete